MKTLKNHLGNFPDIYMYGIFIFLVTYCTWKRDIQRLQTYSNNNRNGFRLFSANRIAHVQISEVFLHDYLYIQASCVSETRQMPDPYCVLVLINQSERVLFGECTCVA